MLPSAKQKTSTITKCSGEDRAQVFFYLTLISVNQFIRGNQERGIH